MAEQRSSRTTIRDIAQIAGVSIGTVSRVLNRHPNVHDRTRTRVLETMRGLNYEPVFAAQELGRGNRPTVGLSAGLGTRRLVPFFQVFLDALIESVSADGFRFVEVPTGNDALPKHLTDGMVLFGAHDDDSRIPYLRENQIPFVLIGYSSECNSVASDDYTGGRLAAEHLIRLGHRQILVLTGELTGQASRDRLQGARDALEEHGIPLSPELIVETEFDSLGGYRAVRNQLSQETTFSAIIAASDELALGARIACTDVGVRVPEDVSIVGFDDLPEIGVDLTTIHQDFEKLAATAVRLLRQAMDGASPEQIRVPVRLVTRKSTSRKLSS